jgi:hypothetical protein
MGIGKNHEKKKKANYQARKVKLVESTESEIERSKVIDREAIDNLHSLNRDKAQPVEGYRPLFKELLKQYPIEKRY